MASCTRTTWRGVIVCAHTVPMLNNWAASVGNDILLKPLAGCGSYQTTTAASAGTHAGGGAIDIDLRAVPSDKRKWVADKGRVAGLQVSWHRNYVAGLWTWHAHALDPGCPNLANAAVAQIVEFKNGGDGLVGSTPDGNTRVNVNQLVSIFTSRLIVTVGDITSDAKVRLLQQAVRIGVDGKWGAVTEKALSSAKAEAQAGYSGKFFNSKSDADQREMQRNWGTTADGIWGPATASALKSTIINMQKALGVTADGVWGPVTDAAYQKLRSSNYSTATAPAPAPKPTAPSTTVSGVDTRNMAVGLTAPITRSNLKVGAKNGDVSRYQAALWNRTPIAMKVEWVKKWGLTRADIYDGVYGKATADLTARIYTLLNQMYPGGGWTPGATEPGPGLLKRIGFTSIR